MKGRIDPVQDAVRLRDTEALLDSLARGCGLEATDREGRTPLANAVLNEDFEVAGILLRSGANPSSSDTRGLTPLHHAAQRYSIELTNLLIGFGADVHARDAFGNTPLFRAVFESRGRPEVIDALLSAGGDQNSINASGVSPRDLAKTIANFDVLSLLRDLEARNDS